MFVAVNPADEIPIFRQIVRQIAQAAATGALKPGQKLPSHRELSEQLVIAPLTVKKAYDELELLGFIGTQRGRGTFVNDHLPQPAGDKLDHIRDYARHFLANAYVAGMRFPQVIELLEDVQREQSQIEQKEHA